MRPVPLLALLLLFCAGCASVDERALADTPVSLGMTKADLHSYFGAPRKVITHPDGSADWIYRFAIVESRGERHRTISGSSVGEWLQGSTVTKTWTAPVHLSPDGVVVAPVPEGQILRR